ncbi:hypothetical protein KP509_30G002000 [Ceratopteris richardii]|uniref:C2 domain-containing protein n=2 Tax=Ceratopteris richardii TaxID=49495 RepID=A0A8T2QZL2_CERRI|nr:hypothetical protein KP509_30G002000 [Ceratopteris richardii]
MSSRSLDVTLISASISLHASFTTEPRDTYAIIRCAGTQYRTKGARDQGRLPVWNETFTFHLQQSDLCSDLVVQVLNGKSENDEVLGTARIPIPHMIKKDDASLWSLVNSNQTEIGKLKAIWKSKQAYQGSFEALDTVSDALAKLSMQRRSEQYSSLPAGEFDSPSKGEKYQAGDYSHPPAPGGYPVSHVPTSSISYPPVEGAYTQHPTGAYPPTLPSYSHDKQESVDYPGSTFASSWPEQASGGHPPQSGAYPSQTGSYPPQTGAYPLQTGAYPLQTGAYPPQAGPYPPQTGAYAGELGAYPPQTGAEPPQSGAYPLYTGTYAPQTGAYPPQTGTYPPQTGTYAGESGPYPPQTGFPTFSETYPPYEDSSKLPFPSQYVTNEAAVYMERGAKDTDKGSKKKEKEDKGKEKDGKQKEKEGKGKEKDGKQKDKEGKGKEKGKEHSFHKMDGQLPPPGYPPSSYPPPPGYPPSSYPPPPGYPPSSYPPPPGGSSPYYHPQPNVNPPASHGYPPDPHAYPPAPHGYPPPPGYPLTAHPGQSYQPTNLATGLPPGGYPVPGHDDKGHHAFMPGHGAVGSYIAHSVSSSKHSKKHKEPKHSFSHKHSSHKYGKHKKQKAFKGMKLKKFKMFKF